MNWPLVSRRAYDDMREQRDHYRALLDTALDHNRRIDRRTIGLSEAPRPAPHAVELTREIVEHIALYESQEVRASLEAQARRALAMGKTPEQIIAQLQEALGE